MSRILIAAILMVSACSTETPFVPATSYRDNDVAMGSIATFDVERFAGRWYEIASYPVPFQAGCSNTQAVYALRPDGTLSVDNSCIAEDGRPRSISGKARPSGPGRLEVTFDRVPFLTSPYWVLWVDEGYRTAVVGVPSGRAGWILNREPTIPADRLEAAKSILAFNGYDISRLRGTVQHTRP